MILTFNIFLNGDQEVIDKLLNPKTCTHSVQTRGHNKKLNKEYSRLDIRKHLFTQRIVNTWNNLPSNIVNAPDTHTFKRLLDDFMSCHMYLFDE